MIDTPETDRPLYRVWNVLNPPNNPTYLMADNPEQAATLIDQWATAQLESESVRVHIFGLEVYDPNTEDWDEWYDENGNSVHEILEEIRRTEED